MNDKQFFNNLSATYADVRRLDAKKINLKGKNILEYIEENGTIILDERGTLANDELDVWNSYITKDENGNVIVNRNAKPKEHSVKMNDETYETVYEGITKSQVNTLKTAVKVINNEVLGANDEHVMYWQTNGLTNGGGMFYHTNLESFSSDLSSLTNGYCMFYTTKLESFSSDLSSLTDGNNMFCCSKLTSFSHDLPSLTNGSGMFGNCTNLTSFSSELPSLTNGGGMFYFCTNLTTFSSDLSSLTDGRIMFYATKLTSFSSDLSSLTNGEEMFCGCTNLTSFSSDLSSLTNGEGMFNQCKLDAQSVANIIHFIPQRDAKPTSTEDEGNITIGLGIANTEEAKQAFAEELDCVDWADLNKEIDDKNWAVVWQFNGEASTFDLRSPRPSTAVFARLEEVIMPTDEKAIKPPYKYTSQDGSKFYNIHWYHDSNTNNEGYDYFESLEEAIAAYGVIAK